MRIVDLRHFAVRQLTGRWLASRAETPKGLGAAATRLADVWMERMAARRPVSTPPPVVVSIGNLALGGTGKTPVTAQLGLDLAAAGFRGAVLTRGFGSRLRGPLMVGARTEGAGDEARLLAGLLAPSGWSVVQARHRPRGLAWLQAQAPDLDVILLEDAYQTAGMGRHLDIVILDSWRAVGPASDRRLEPLTGAVAPFGPWRESARGARRAGIWLVESMPPVPPGPDGIPVARFSRSFHLTGPTDTTAGPAVLLSGIARPAVFEAEAERHLGQRPALAIRCADHESYGPRLLAKIDGLLRAAEAALVVTTSKDWVKLAPVWGTRPPLAVLEMRVCWEGDTALPDLVRERLDVVRRRELSR
jgi:tetraacyldisaccharide 4'-kinase